MESDVASPAAPPTGSPVQQFRLMGGALLVELKPMGVRAMNRIARTIETKYGKTVEKRTPEVLHYLEQEYKKMVALIEKSDLEITPPDPPDKLVAAGLAMVDLFRDYVDVLLDYAEDKALRVLQAPSDDFQLDIDSLSVYDQKEIVDRYIFSFTLGQGGAAEADAFRAEDGGDTGRISDEVRAIAE